VLYVLLSDRNKVRLDLLTAVFFFLFNGVLLVTGYVFVQSAIEVGEVSMTEWGIQYWAVKIALPLGAVLILLQGCVRVFKNITYLRTKEI
jgi:TRAP-type mannitol/chloroaromatic compound transport system permease small subunit